MKIRGRKNQLVRDRYGEDRLALLDGEEITLDITKDRRAGLNLGYQVVEVFYYHKDHHASEGGTTTRVVVEDQKMIAITAPHEIKGDEVVSIVFKHDLQLSGNSTHLLVRLKYSAMAQATTVRLSHKLFRFDIQQKILQAKQRLQPCD